MLKGLKDKTFNISSSAKRIICILGIAIIVMGTIGAVFASEKTVTIVDENNSEKEVSTFKRYVEGVLDAEGIVLDDADKLNVKLDDKLKDDMRIEIYRAFPVAVVEKGEKKIYKTTKHVVGEVLAELGLNAKNTDKTTPGYYETISEYSEIVLVRTEEKFVEENEEIPFECVERVNKSLATGQKKTIQNGKPGEKMVSYKIAYEDGVEVSRERVSERVVLKPISQIREVAPRKIDQYQIASAGAIQTSRSGNLAYSKVIMATATAYDASSCGKSPSHPAYGITATGARAGKGIIAVDPRVIPLGTKLYVETADGSYVYGTAIAADTGGAIKGNRIDLCYDTRAEAINFGRRQVKVYILK